MLKCEKLFYKRCILFDISEICFYADFDVGYDWFDSLLYCKVYLSLYPTLLSKIPTIIYNYYFNNPFAYYVFKRCATFRWYNPKNYISNRCNMDGIICILVIILFSRRFDLFNCKAISIHSAEIPTYYKSYCNNSGTFNRYLRILSRKYNKNS